MRMRSGSSSGVERKLPKLDVAGSTPVSRSNLHLLTSAKCGPLYTPQPTLACPDPVELRHSNWLLSSTCL